MTRLRSTSAAAEDRRLVQTAVRGTTADSEDAVFLPIERDAASEFRDAHDSSGAAFWCGTAKGCRRRLSIRIYEDKIPHFYHLGDSDVACRLTQGNRGRLEIEATIAWGELRRWRETRDLPEGTVDFFDPIERVDARYLHITGPPGTRDTRVVLGDVAIIEVQEDAKSPQGREWDWFVHHSNTMLRNILDEQGISYARIRFTPTEHSAMMQVFLVAPDNVGDWGRVSHYEPAPHRRPRPPAPSLPAQADPEPVQVQVPSAPSHTRVLTRGPTSSRQHAPGVEARAPRNGDRRADEIADARAHLQEALTRGDRRAIGRCARRLNALRKDNRARLSRAENQDIKALLRRANTSV